MNSIYDRLLAGESIDDIMNQFADEANAAQARIAEEEAARKAEEEARAAAVAAEKAAADAKKSDLMDVLDAMFTYLAKHYPTFGVEADSWDDDDLRLIAEAGIMALELEQLKVRKPAKTTKVEKRVKTTDDIFSDFFKSFGLLS